MDKEKMIFKFEAGSKNAQMRTLLIKFRSVIQLTFIQTKTRMLYWGCEPSVDFPTLDKGEGELIRGIRRAGESVSVLLGVGCNQEELILHCISLNASQCAVKMSVPIPVCALVSGQLAPLWHDWEKTRRSVRNAPALCRCFCSGNSDTKDSLIVEYQFESNQAPSLCFCL